MNAKTTATKIALVTIATAAAGTGLAGTASADVTEGSYTAKKFLLGPTVYPLFTAEADVVGDQLIIGGLTATITPTETGGTAVVAGQEITLTEVPSVGGYVINTGSGVTLGQLDAR